MRFYTSYTNRRHNSYGAGILGGDPVHTRGWNAGVSVTAYDDSGRDSFVVRMTHGSHEGGLSTDLGTVRDTPDGPRWEPADKPGPARVPVRVRTSGHPTDRYTLPVIAAIPMQSHRNETDPDEYACAVGTGRWPSGEPTFGTIVATRDGDHWVTESSAYDMGPLGRPRSLTGAVSEMIRLAGHERPSCTRTHTTPREQEK